MPLRPGRRRPGAAPPRARTESVEWPANVTWRPKKHGAGKEKRWWKRLPIVVSHETRAVYRGERVVWCYALSDAAKEAWTVALHQEVVRSRAMMDRAVLSAASVAGPSREGGLRRGDRERKDAGPRGRRREDGRAAVLRGGRSRRRSSITSPRARGVL